ncbi:MAG: protein kinase [Candidatus Eisenbacteria bacterium]
MVGTRLSHYQLLERLGAGGMGEVFRARDVSDGAEVALKLLRPELATSPEQLRRFEHEVRALTSLQHPNIVAIHQVEEAEGVRFFTMQLIEGRPLKELISVDGLPLAQFLTLAIGITRAVGAAHDAGLTHRDLKPSNILVSSDGVPKVLDFGLVKLRPPRAEEGAPEASTLDLSQSGLVVGTFPYMSPEQARGEEVDSRSDLFSLGVLFYEMATGRRPFQGATTAELLSSILRDRPRLASELRPTLPPRLGRLLARCLEKAPEARIESHALLRAELESIQRGDEAPDAPTRPSIAVLPLVDESPGGSREHLCEGISEELIRVLDRLKGLRVASRAASFRYTRSALDLVTIGRVLGCDSLLCGRLEESDNRLRIEVRLLRVTDGVELWTGRFDRELRDVFAIQEEIAENVVRTLAVNLTPGEPRPFSSLETRDPVAFDYYLRGRRFFYQYWRRGIELALQMFTLAIKHDPEYARAYAGIADCCAFLYLYADRRQESLDRADAASRRALELDPDSAEAHASRGQVLSLSHADDAAEAEFVNAIRLGPSLFEAYYLYGRHAFAQGRLEDAARLLARASDLNPHDYQAPLLVAQILCDLGRPTEAAESRRRGVRIVEERLTQQPDDVRALYMGANGLMALGERERSLEWTGLALSMEPTEPMVLYNVACIHAMAGDLEEAMTLLERAVDAGLSQRGWILHDNNLDPIRTLPRFRTLLERVD